MLMHVLLCVCVCECWLCCSCCLHVCVSARLPFVCVCVLSRNDVCVYTYVLVFVSLNARRPFYTLTYKSSNLSYLRRQLVESMNCMQQIPRETWAFACLANGHSLRYTCLCLWTWNEGHWCCAPQILLLPQPRVYIPVLWHIPRWYSPHGSDPGSVGISGYISRFHTKFLYLIRALKFLSILSDLCNLLNKKCLLIKRNGIHSTFFELIP